MTNGAKFLLDTNYILGLLKSNPDVIAEISTRGLKLSLEPGEEFSTLRDSLIQLALQNKVVVLFVKKDENDNKPCITGFNYPAQ